MNEKVELSFKFYTNVDFFSFKSSEKPDHLFDVMNLEY